ncbi:MAG: phosphoribosyltransferase, partial [Nitrospinota bacterium]
IVAIPKGGVPVAVPLARRLDLPIDLCIMAKIPLPWRREAGVGALAADGTLRLNHELIHVLALEEEAVSQAIEEAHEILEERIRNLGAFADLPDLRGKTAILVDDGMATGYTALTAVEFLQRLGPDRIIVAAPVSSIYALETLADAGVEAVVLTSGDGPFFDVSTYYGDFEELPDAQVRRLLENSTRSARAAS